MNQPIGGARRGAELWCLYVLVDVNDDVCQGGTDHPWEDDSVEIYLDGGGERAQQYDGNDYQYVFRWDDSALHVGARSAPLDPNVRFATVRTSTGYRLEAAIPWSSLGGEVGVGRRFGLEVHVNDDDDGGDRDSKIAWNAARDDAWENPQAFRSVELSNEGRATFTLDVAPSYVPLLDGNLDDSFLKFAPQSIARRLRGTVPFLPAICPPAGGRSTILCISTYSSKWRTTESSATAMARTLGKTTR
jgi:hypothetical protein